MLEVKLLTSIDCLYVRYEEGEGVRNDASKRLHICVFLLPLDAGRELIQRGCSAMHETKDPYRLMRKEED